MKPIHPHDSMRGHFAWHLYDYMEKDKNIMLVCVDLGYGMFDAIRDGFPDQVIITGASEQAAMGMAVGLALSGKIPLVYSITPFLLWRSAETLRLYLNHENIPVKLIGSGRDTDYEHDGYSHDATDAHAFLELLPNIHQYFPEKEYVAGKSFTVAEGLERLLYNGKPTFMSLKRKW